jgi:hypothetical protein
MNALIPSLFDQDAATFGAATMPVSSTPFVLDWVENLRGGDPATDLDAVPTATKAVSRKPYFVRLDPDGEFRAAYLSAGAANPADPAEVAPMDFNPARPVHWELG